MGTRRQTRPQTRRRHFIKEWRLHRGLTQEQLAGRIESSISTISQLESGKQGYSQALLEELAEALMCEPWDLLNVDPSKEGDVVDFTSLLKRASPEDRDAIISFAKGRLSR